MSNKEYTVYFEDLTKQSFKAENIIAALQSVTQVEKVIRISLCEKKKHSISSQVVDDDFLSDDFNPPANM